ncbi:MAG: hypothetical protein GX306_05045 [Clostridiales bacterium]|jgi:hypothetical protein|nr:hypothetical protein [Clostridiales bacterium]
MKKLHVIKNITILTIICLLVGSNTIFSRGLMGNLIAVAKADEHTSQAIGLINIEYRTQEEIREYIRTNGATLNDPITYEKKPNVNGPYDMGALSKETLNSAISMINQVRFIAGLNYDVKLNSEYSKLTQAASLMNYLNNTLSHYPVKPNGVNESLYELGRTGASSSNIAWNYSNLNRSIVHGYMADDDSGNRVMVGHRRWILNPPMGATGFGAVHEFSAMYAFDKSGGMYASGVAWPAQTMPTDYFSPGYPWSISMGEEIEKSQVKVTLERLRDNKVWEFSDHKADGYFNVNNGGYGQKGCIIFVPEGIDCFLDQDKFQVNITGLSRPVSYQVTFFDLVVPTSFEVMADDEKIYLGERTYVEAKILPENVTNDEVLWKSSDESIATVTDYGMVQSKQYGTVTITGTYQSTGLEASVQIKIVPRTQEIYSLSSPKKGAFTVTYAKDTTVTGYQVTYATNHDFTKNKKSKTIKKNTSNKTTIKNLKAGKKYYVKVRAFYEKDGVRTYGSYSKVQTVTVKK